MITAADAGGVQPIAYTSLLRADSSPLMAAVEPKPAEELLAAAAATTSFMRHGWYAENYTGNLAPALANGAFVGSAQWQQLSPHLSDPHQHQHAYAEQFANVADAPIS